MTDKGEPTGLSIATMRRNAKAQRAFFEKMRKDMEAGGHPPAHQTSAVMAQWMATAPELEGPENAAFGIAAWMVAATEIKSLSMTFEFLCYVLENLKALGVEEDDETFALTYSPEDGPKWSMRPHDEPSALSGRVDISSDNLEEALEQVQKEIEQAFRNRKPKNKMH